MGNPSGFYGCLLYFKTAPSTKNTPGKSEDTAFRATEVEIIINKVNNKIIQ